MKRNIIFCFCAIAAYAIVLGSSSPKEKGDVEVIPYPLSVDVNSHLCNLASIRYIRPLDEDAAYAAVILQKALNGMGFSAELVPPTSGKGSAASGRNSITISSSAEGTAESYTLTVRKHRAAIEGSGRNGAIYGAQTFIQQAGKGGVKTGTIYDEPRFKWRGYMLDESRHFFGEAFVREILREMSYFKMNRFHWHLTDAPGWRIEIKKYPKLTQIGSIGCHSNPDSPAAFYTQEQIKAIVAYADSLGITIVPEIDMPGHATSSNRSYPMYSGGGNNFTFNPGVEGVYSYLTDIINEVSGLFPGKYLHIGGDEVSMGTKSWKTDENIQALVNRESMSGLHDVEAYFVNRMADSVKQAGRVMLGWDDMYECQPDPSNTVFTWWRQDRDDHLRNALDKGYGVVLCPRLPYYFDFIQNKEHKCGRVWKDGRICPLDEVYAFPESDSERWKLTPGSEKGILGMQANLWAELVHTVYRAEFMTFPRIIALSESCWTKAESKDYDSFCSRLEKEYLRLDSIGINYYDHRDPARHAEPLGPFKH